MYMGWKRPYAVSLLMVLRFTLYSVWQDQQRVRIPYYFHPPESALLHRDVAMQVQTSANETGFPGMENLFRRLKQWNIYTQLL